MTEQLHPSRCRHVPTAAALAVVLLAAVTADVTKAPAQPRAGTTVLTREALERIEDSLPERRARAGGDDALVTALMQLAAGYGDFGELDKAFTYAREAVDTAGRTKSLLGPIASVTLGSVYRSRGQLREARQTLETAMPVLQNLRAIEPLLAQHLANAINNLALIDSDLGRYAAAATRFAEAAATLRDIPRDRGSDRDLRFKQLEGNSRSNLAHTLLELGRVADAVEQRRVALDLAQAAGDRTGVAISHESLGTALNRQGNRAGAIREFESAIALARELRQRSVEAGALHGLATAQWRSGQRVDAEASFRRAIALREELGQRGQSLWFGPRVGLASLLDGDGRVADAASLFDDTIAVLRERLTLHAGFLSETEQVAFRRDMALAVDEYFSFCVRHHRQMPVLAARMLDVLLWEKGFVVSREALRKSAVESAGVQALEQQLVSARTEASVAARARRAGAQALQERVLELERRLTTSVAEHRGDPIDATWVDVQRALTRRQAAVEIAAFSSRDDTGRFEERHVALVVTRGRTAPTLVDLGAGPAVTAALEDYRRLTSSDPDDQAGRLAASTLWAPLAGAVDGADQLVIAADGVLHTVNWNILPADRNRRVLDVYDIRTVGSTRDLLRPTRPRSTGRAVIFDDPDFGPEGRAEGDPCQTGTGVTFGRLIGTGDEGYAIRDVLERSRWQVERRTRGDATESNVKQVRGPRLMHLATHGCLTATDPAAAVVDPMLRSYLVFAGFNTPGLRGAAGAGEDAALTAYEVAGLDLRGTELVVLSACNTGRGDETNGEGVLGLRRAFQIAGAEAVITTLWAVPDDTTARLMQRFYTHWTAGLDKRAALRRAQRELRTEWRETGQDTPHWWGGFVLLE